PRPTISTLLPYTTLFRSIVRCFAPRKDDGHEISLRNGRRVSIATRSLDAEPGQLVMLQDLTETRRLQEQLARHERLSALGHMVRSEEHTSELQSRENLVC